MVTQIFIGLFFAILAALFKSSIKAFIKNSFSKLSPNQVQKGFVLFVALVFALPFLILNGGLNINIIHEDLAPIEPEKSATLEEEMITKAVDIGEEVIRTELQKKQIRDSIRRANKAERWVYQIGLPSEKKNEALYELYNNLKEQGNIYAFEKDRNQYILYKDDGLDQQELLDSLISFQKLIGDRTVRIEVINLMDFCKLKHEVVRTKPISWRKADGEIACFKCD